MSFVLLGSSSSVETLTPFSSVTEESSIRLVVLRKCEGVSGPKTVRGKRTAAKEAL